MQRLLTELAQHPERHGIERPRDQETLKRALKQAEGLPEKALKDPEVRRIITEAVEEQRNKPEVTPEERQERRRWEELADRFLPRKAVPLILAGTPATIPTTRRSRCPATRSQRAGDRRTRAGRPRPVPP